MTYGRGWIMGQAETDEERDYERVVATLGVACDVLKRRGTGDELIVNGLMQNCVERLVAAVGPERAVAFLQMVTHNLAAGGYDSGPAAGRPH